MRAPATPPPRGGAGTHFWTQQCQGWAKCVVEGSLGAVPRKKHGLPPGFSGRCTRSTTRAISAPA